MKSEAETALMRRDIDGLLRKAKHLPAAPPKRGWIHDIREALGMCGLDLAKRMKISSSAMSGLELSEAQETIQLATLRRAATALDCTLVYALVPRHSLEKTVAKRRRLIAMRDLSKVIPVLTLASGEMQCLLEDYGKRVSPKRLWRDESKVVLQPLPHAKKKEAGKEDDAAAEGEEEELQDRPPDWGD